jgi:hypothetical protein
MVIFAKTLGRVSDGSNYQRQEMKPLGYKEAEHSSMLSNQVWLPLEAGLNSDK